jgi:uncharacterized protein YjiS (DUF1127 family)
MTRFETHPTPGDIALQLELARLETRALARIALASAWLLLKRVPLTVRHWRSRMGHPRSLAALDDNLLRDIGLHRERRDNIWSDRFWQV